MVDLREEVAAPKKRKRLLRKAHIPIVRCTVCDVPYVLRFSLRMSGPAEWLYQRDCKHKTGLPTGEVSVEDMETAPVLGFATALVKVTVDD